MRQLLAIAGLASALLIGAAQAQIVPPPVPSIVPPPPKIEVPEVPKMDNPPKSKAMPPQRRSSFHDRMVSCLTDDVALRLSPGERTTYSRACANRTE